MEMEKFDYLYWFDRLLSVETFQEAEIFSQELIAKLAKYPNTNCNIGGLCKCRETQNICSNMAIILVGSACTQFMALGLPMSILDNLGEIGKIRLPILILRRVPDINLLLRYSNRIKDEKFLHKVFSIGVKNDLVAFVREMFVRNLVKGKRFGYTKPLSQEMMELFMEYGMEFVLVEDENPFNFEEKMAIVLAGEVDFSYGGMVLNTLLINEDINRRMNLLKNVPKIPLEEFYFFVYSCYFIYDLKNARDYFPDKF